MKLTIDLPDTITAVSVTYVYTDNVDDLPTAKDCWFDLDSSSGMSYTSVTSLNYREQFPGVVAWMPLPEPLPKPYREEDRE